MNFESGPRFAEIWLRWIKKYLASLNFVTVLINKPFASSMKLELNFDQTFEAKFGDNSVNTIRRVATHAANMFTWYFLLIK